MVIKLSPKIEKEVSITIKDYGYRDEREFIEDALRHRILELKKDDFLKKVRKIKAKMKERGISEEEILEDFDRFYHER